MKKETLYDLACKEFPPFKEIPLSKLEQVPFYGELYNHTLARQDVDVTNILEIVKRVKPKRVLELFAGEGAESKKLRSLYGNAEYFQLDYGYAKSSKRRIKGDCINDIYIGTNKFDFVFTGCTNSSLCCVKSVKELISHFIFVGSALNPNGVYSTAFFENVVNPFDFTEFDGNYYLYNSKYEGKKVFVHTYIIIEPVRFKGWHDMRMLCMMSSTPELTKETFVKGYFNLYGGEHKAWSIDTVFDVADMCGFRLAEEYVKPPIHKISTEAIPFVKK